MNSKERNDYIIATIISIIFHVLLLVIVFPAGFLFGKPGGTDIFAAEIVEFPSSEMNPQEMNPSELNQAIETAEAKPDQIEEKQPVSKEQNKGESLSVRPPDVKQDLTKVKPLEAKPEIAKESKPKTESEPVTKPDLKTTSTDNNKTTTDLPAQPTLPSGPKSLGNGTGMVVRGLTGRNYPYPKNAANLDLEGEVLLRVEVEAGGKIAKIDFLKSSDNREMDRAARGYVLNDWIFKPFDDDYYIDLLVKFKIEDGKYLVIIEPVKSETRP
ncbi:MAG TPA: TonB family protein [Bacillota bacterium]|jgi:TonB family protein|nr:TonB family protein [Bacillota bacterium]